VKTNVQVRKYVGHTAPAKELKDSDFSFKKNTFK
jgi:hypothetical protein